MRAGTAGTLVLPAVLAIAWSAAWAGDADVEVYASLPKDICFSSATTESGWGDCLRLRDELVLQRGAGGRVDVHLETVWTNGHTCSFHGTAQGQGPRLVATSEDQPDCPLVLEFRATSVSTSYRAPGCQPASCGMRGSIDGIVLERVPCAGPDGTWTANEETPWRCAGAAPSSTSPGPGG